MLEIPKRNQLRILLCSMWFFIAIAPVFVQEAMPLRKNVIVVDTVSAFIPTLISHYLLSAEYQHAFGPSMGVDASFGLFMDKGEHGPSFMPQGGIGLRWMFGKKGLGSFYARAGWTTPREFGYNWFELSLGREYWVVNRLVFDSRISAVYFPGGYIGFRLDLLRFGVAF